MARKKRYAQDSEYGGGDGLVQRFPGGESIELPGIASSNGERATLMRMAGSEDYDPTEDTLVGAALTTMDVAKMSAAQREAYEKDLLLSAERARRRDRLQEATNDYIDEPEQYIGEDGSAPPRFEVG